ncbi:MAG TPA: alpha/beta fold hydrolase [Casimicrobiaceae bacterium]|nr:alpha/beta fold hydrolase [Casimicrobiaceae bacterium]
MPAHAPLPTRPDSSSTAPGAGYGSLVQGRGAAVVMLHASLGSKSQWSALIGVTAPRYRAIALDLTGYGDLPSAEPDVPSDVDDDVRALERRLDGLVAPRSRIHLVGHSYGGFVALRYARLHPERVASLALYEPVAFRMLPPHDASRAELERLAEEVAALVQGGHRHLASQVFVDFWSGEGTFASLPLAARASIARRIGKVPLDFRAALAWPTDASDLRTISAPALLVAGRRSPALARSIVAALARALPDARSAWIDAGHMGPVTDAADFAALVASFLGECEDARAVRWAARAA